MSQAVALYLNQLLERVARLVAHPSVQMQWVVAEISEYRGRPGSHAYSTLIQRDPATGAEVAKASAKLWATQRRLVEQKFLAATGQPLAAGMNVMFCVSATYHPAYGFSLVIHDVEPSYTLGETELRRRAILNRLKAEGIIGQNRALTFPLMPQQVAVISLAGAAGYGDFIKQICHNPRRIRFNVTLYNAMMQGEKTVSTVLDALTRIATAPQLPDVVVIARGGGAAADLQWFDNYDLAAAVACFPVPVVIAIGHDRDVNVLDMVGWSVKTPTAAAELLISKGTALLDQLTQAAMAIRGLASDRISGEKQRLAYCQGLLPTLPGNAITRQRARLSSAAAGIFQAGTRIKVAQNNLSRYPAALQVAADNAINRQQRLLDAKEQLLNALSPQATLQRGYSLTLDINGHAVTSPDQLMPGDAITTRLANGQISSVVTSTQ